MRAVLRTSRHATRRRSFLLKTSPVVPPASSLSRAKQLCIRLSSTAAGHKSAAKNQTKNGTNTPSKSQFLTSISPLPTPPPPPKGTPLTINTHDIEQYVQPLYARGWGLSLSRSLPNGNDTVVLRKRFEFANAEDLEGFLADLSEYEEKKQHHAKTDVFGYQHALLVSTWTHVARRRSQTDAKVEDRDEKIQGVTARDIRLAYALEELFENALVAGGREYVPLVRPEADRPKTVEELNGYTW